MHRLIDLLADLDNPTQFADGLIEPDDPLTKLDVVIDVLLDERIKRLYTLYRQAKRDAERALLHLAAATRRQQVTSAQVYKHWCCEKRAHALFYLFQNVIEDQYNIPAHNVFLRKGWNVVMVIIP